MNSKKEEGRRLPPDLSALPCIEAVAKYRIGDGKPFPSLEGTIFDRDGNYYVCYTIPDDTTIKKITPDGEIKDFFHIDKGMIIGLAVHKDGRFFASDMLRNSIRIISADGKQERELFPEWEGTALKPDCMAFDRLGNLYFTDLRGTVVRPDGGIYRLEAESDYREVTLVWKGMASPNGLAFSPAYDVLWVAETAGNTLVRIQMKPDGTVLEKQYSPIPVYRNTGRPCLDTNRVDAEGNVYQAVMFGGRAMIMDEEGIPVANIVVPDRKSGALKYTPNLVLHPSRAEGYLLASDEKDALVLSFPALAPSMKLYSHEE